MMGVEELQAALFLLPHNPGLRGSRGASFRKEGLLKSSLNCFSPSQSPSAENTDVVLILANVSVFVRSLQDVGATHHGLQPISMEHHHDHQHDCHLPSCRGLWWWWTACACTGWLLLIKCNCNFNEYFFLYAYSAFPEKTFYINIKITTLHWDTNTGQLMNQHKTRQDINHKLKAVLKGCILRWGLEVWRSVQSHAKGCRSRSLYFESGKAQDIKLT